MSRSFIEPEMLTEPAALERHMRGFVAELTHERAWALGLAHDGRLVQRVTVGTGDHASVLMPPRAVFAWFLTQPAIVACIAVHNHCTPNLEPSREDVAVTEVLVEAGEVLACPLIDHVILSPYRPGEWFSMRERLESLFTGTSLSEREGLAGVARYVPPTPYRADLPRELPDNPQREKRSRMSPPRSRRHP